ncbi:hypothetical protein V8F06_010716, partial [Rhypophila decipiens]
KYTPYLPCHYFDYIAGTSTGSLITVMLARLRMPVEDCLAEYNRFGGSVFGKPRTFHQVGKRGILFTNTKFKTSHLEDAIKDVIRRRGEVDNRVSAQKGDIILFRSYDHFHSRSGDRPDNKAGKGPRNPGYGTCFAAWKVARAATAAKLFFKPLVVVKGDGEIMPTLPGNGFKPPETIYLTDAGYGRANNPSEQVLLELRSLLANRNKKINTWVSVGTARSDKDKYPEEKKLRFTTPRVIMEGLNKLGDTEPVHEHMEVESRKNNGAGFYYVRLNEPGGLDIEMDEWKISGDINQTLEAIKVSFNNWASKTENVDKLQECARALVQNRRERAKNRPRWDRYALGSFYICGQKNCAYDCDKTWDYRDEFEKHLTDHGIAAGETLTRMTRDCEQHWDYKPPPSTGGVFH